MAISALLKASAGRWWKGCKLSTLEIHSDSSNQQQELQLLHQHRRHEQWPSLTANVAESSSSVDNRLLEGKHQWSYQTSTHMPPCSSAGSMVLVSVLAGVCRCVSSHASLPGGDITHIDAACSEQYEQQAGFLQPCTLPLTTPTAIGPCKDDCDCRYNDAMETGFAKAH
jgi:hypothetical protein